MSLTAYAQWADHNDTFQIGADGNPQFIADHIVATMSVDHPIDYPDTIALFRNGDNSPIFVNCLALGFHYIDTRLNDKDAIIARRILDSLNRRKGK